jgi:hypothetical protein
MGYGSFAGSKKNETPETQLALSKKLRYFKTVNIYAVGDTPPPGSKRKK